MQTKTWETKATPQQITREASSRCLVPKAPIASNGNVVIEVCSFRDDVFGRSVIERETSRSKLNHSSSGDSTLLLAKRVHFFVTTTVVVPL